MAGAVLVTGCSSGIGRATARRLVGAGWSVVATARRPDTLDELVAAGCRAEALDVTDDAAMTGLLDRLAAEGTPVAALVNNAGYGLHGAAETTPLDEARRQFETNFFGLVRLTQLVLPAMRAAGEGRVVNVSSMGGRLTLPGGAFYHASKHAVEAFSDALRVEVAPFGVRVVLVEPGPVRSPWVDTALGTVGAAHGDGDPYAAFHRVLAARLAGAYRGGAGRMASSPEAVARVVERALRVPRPRARYLVGPVARTLVGLHAALPDRLWDAAVARPYGLRRPG